MPWKKGASGNPKGRPKENKVVRELARQYTEEAVLKLVEWMRGSEGKASVSAAMGLLAYGWGKPAQAVEVSGPDGDAIQIQAGIDRPPPAKSFEEWQERWKPKK